MTGPAARPPAARRRAARLNFTLLQFVLFAGAGGVALAALLAAGLAFGLALAGSAMIAVLVLAVWVVTANLAGSGASTRRPPRA